MIKHLIKYLWSKKRSNALITIETAVAFSILFVVLAHISFSITAYKAPKGYDQQNIWNVNMASPYSFDQPIPPQDYAMFRDLAESLKSFDVVEAVTFLTAPPYSGWTWGSNVFYNETEATIEINFFAPSAFEVLKVPLIAGRFLTQADIDDDKSAVVINRKLALELFGSEPAVGKMIRRGNDEELEIVGVIEDFKAHGEFQQATNYVIGEQNMSPTEAGRHFSMLIKYKGQVNSQIEKQITDHMDAFATGWSFGLTKLETLRQRHIQDNMRPLLITGIICAFLMLMVAFGLFGVLWQNVIARTKELGLRRALGATASEIRTQVVAERLLISTSAILIASVFLVQLPLLGAVPFINWTTFSIGFGGAFCGILLLTFLCSLYPSVLATRIQPSQALHYE